jgi:hypothetical protein
MSKDPSISLSDRIEQIERRLERRRSLLTEDSQEAADAASETVSRVVPIAAVIGAALAGLWVGTRFTGGRRRRRFEPAQAAPGVQARRGRRWASLLGIVGSAVRIGSSREARMVFDAIRRRRGGPTV